MDKIGWSPSTLEERVTFYVFLRRDDDIVNLGKEDQEVVKLLLGFLEVYGEAVAETFVNIKRVVSQIGQPATECLLEYLKKGSVYYNVPIYWTTVLGGYGRIKAYEKAIAKTESVPCFSRSAGRKDFQAVQRLSN